VAVRSRGWVMRPDNAGKIRAGKTITDLTEGA
jgi:hypothetical protein